MYSVVSIVSRFRSRRDTGQSKMTELDKFKRRTIRSVARLLRQKKPPDELWSEMKKETGTDCRVLWERMRALCIKKLNRMLAVDDRSDSLPSIARLSLTDWLLVDLVLVHEDIDVIATEKTENKGEHKALVQLFNLVQRFDIEGRVGEPLAHAWAAATVFYNRQGRQCSPMLLQRRWYQLKKQTRCRFYVFWQSYRGNTRLLVEARRGMPSRLQMAVAKRYPAVITDTFPEWDQLIEERLVILPEEFESKMRMTNLPKPCSSKDPDLVVVEPVIETIDLRVESDSEEHKEDNIDDNSDPEKSNDATPGPTTEDQAKTNCDIMGVKIKSEPVEEDGLSNVQVVSTSHVTEVELRDSDSPESESDTHQTADENHIDENQILNEDEIDDDVVEIPSPIPTINIDSDSPTKKIAETLPEEMTRLISSESSDNMSVNDDAVVDDIIKIKADEFCRKDSQEVPVITDVSCLVDDLIKDKVETFLKTPTETITFEDKKPDVSAVVLNERQNITAIDLMADLNFIDDGIEFVDDGVEFVEDDDGSNTEPVGKKSPKQPSNKESEDNNKFDLKLLMDPVVYTTKLDHMNVFIKKAFDSVNNKEDIERVVVESKPVSKKSFNINVKQEDKMSQNDNSGVDETGINDDLFTNHEETDDEEVSEEEDVTVSINSNMLKKPRSRAYNPIQLCKNPDFNTKLRRLNIGFFSSTRNRQLLNACIPLTIDVSKSFETKLVDGTLYLKPSGNIVNIVKEEVTEKQKSLVVPTALPVQSLIDNSKENIQDLLATQPKAAIPDPIVSERKKIITLPDIDKVRRINQQLLTAQVPPLRVYSGNTYRPPSQAVTAVGTSAVGEGKQPEAQVKPIQAVPAVTPPVLGTEPAVVKVESEANQDSKIITPDADTIIPAETLPPAKKKLLKIINQAKLLTQEALTKIDIGATKSPSVTPKPGTLVRQVNVKSNEKPEKKKYGVNRVPVPWTPKFVPREKLIDEFLITGDTLNKMLHLMNGEKSIKTCKCCSANQKKAEAKKIQKQKRKERNNSLALNSNDSSNSGLEDKANLNCDQDHTDNVNPSQVDEDTTKAPQNAVQKPVIARGRVVRYCCWAKQKICKRKRITKHTCAPNNCMCCCRDQLGKLDAENNKTKVTAIELSDDDENSLKKACESIENVVQQSRELTHVNVTVQENTHPNIVVMRNISTSTSTDMDMPTPTPADTSQILNQIVIDVPPRLGTPVPPQPPTILTKIIPGDSSNSKRRYSPIKSKVVHARPSPTQSIKCVPCSCQRPAVSQGSQRNIVIDASRNCPLHPTPIAPKSDKVLYLHSKAIAKSPSESPIFLGKNKILLTTVKFPRKDDMTPPDCEAFQAPKIIPTLPLPNGVQLVLLPSGNVTYTLDQGTELSEAQLATLPTIIAAVQEQLNTTPAPPMELVDTDISNITSGNIQPVANISGPEVNANTQIADLSAAAVSLITAEVFQDKDIPQVQEVVKRDTTASTIIDASAEAVTTTKETQSITNTASDLSAAAVSLATTEVFQDEDIPQVQEIIETDKTASTTIDASAEAVTTTKEIQNITNTAADETFAEAGEKINALDREAQKNTLSICNNEDTPSKISETQPAVESELQIEKQNPAIQNVAETTGVKEGMNNRKSLLSDLMEMSGISPEDSTATEPTAAEQTLTETVPVPNPSMLNADQARNLPELSPVTSFAELKYACEQNGKFFKLDFETGVIVPINVCIKKNTKQKVLENPKAVIDLTDDVDDTDDADSTVKPNFEVEQEDSNIPVSKSLLKKPVQYVYKGQTLSVSNIVKPIKLFKAVRPPLLKRNKSLFSAETPPSSKRTHLEKRKQILNKVEAKIDLVDSDAPMEEEYLMDSSEDESSSTDPKSMAVEALDMDALEESDASSDDEPLAKKSKRMKEPFETGIGDGELVTNIRLAMDHLDEDVPDTEPKPSEVTDDAVKDADVPMDARDSPDNANNEELNKDSTVLRFMSVSDQSDNEGEEDCILGV